MAPGAAEDEEARLKEEEEQEQPASSDDGDNNDKPAAPPTTPSSSRISVPKLVAALIMGTLLFLAFVAFLLSFQQAQHAANGVTSSEDAIIFTNLGEVRSRLHSKSDLPVYEFLRLHHRTALLHGSQRNVVSEVFRALNHHSAEEGMPLLVDLFSDLYAVWPNKLPEEKVDELRALLLTSSSTEEEDIRSALQELDLMTEEEDDTMAVEGNATVTAASSSIVELRRTLVRVLDADGCEPFLRQIDRVRVVDFRGSPYGGRGGGGAGASRKKTKRPAVAKEKDDKKKKKKEKEKTPPTEANLLHATDALHKLEEYVDGKDELNDILRSMLLDDLNERP